MHTLKKYENGISEIPAEIAWYMADIMEFRGKEELYSARSPQKLKALRESSIIESSVSSTRIEGVTIEPSRIEPVLKGKSPFHDRDIIEILPDGRRKLRFETVPHDRVKLFMKEWEKRTAALMNSEKIHPLIVMGASNFDFLCIHPFSEGNGRVSRLLFLLHAYHAGIGVGRYISLERIVEDNKEEYYRNLAESSAR